jgi:DNA-binding protein HU-beta
VLLRILGSMLAESSI